MVGKSTGCETVIVSIIVGIRLEIGPVNFRVALLQIAPFGDDQKRNLAKGVECCRDAKTAGADLGVFPELWNSGCTRCQIDAAGRRSMDCFRNRSAEQFLPDIRCFSTGLEHEYCHHVFGGSPTKPRNTVSAESSTLGRQRGSIRFGVAEGDFSRSCRTNPRLSAPEFARFSLAISAFLSPGNGLHTTKRKVEMWSAMVCG